LLAGCVAVPDPLGNTVRTSGGSRFHAPTEVPPAAAESVPVRPEYRLGCTDVVELLFAGPPAWGVLAVVGVDGRLPIREGCQPLVEGKTIAEIEAWLKDQEHVPAGAVQIRVRAARAKTILIVGPVPGVQTWVPYLGPESVPDCLARVPWPGDERERIDWRRVVVLRPNVAVGGTAEEQLVRWGPNATTWCLEPGDEIHLVERWAASWVRMGPPWWERFMKNWRNPAD
jgi:hypothetical protein